MGYRVFLFLASFVVLLGAGLKAQEFPDPQALLSASRAAYEALGSFEAVVTMAFEAPFGSTSLRFKVYFSTPFIRMEYEPKEIFGLSKVVIAIQDHQAGRSFVLYTNGEWEEIHDESLKEEGFLEAIAKNFLLTTDFERVERGEFKGKPAWVLRGTGTALGGIWGEITLWLEEETLFVWRIESKGFGFTVTLTVEEFNPGAEIPPDLFKPPAPEAIARRFTVIPQGREIIRAVWEKLSDLESFVVHKRVRSGYFRDEEHIVIYRHPFLRIETRSPSTPYFPSQLLRVEIHDFSSGYMYSYDPFENAWEKEEIFPFADFDFPAASTRLFAFFEAFRLEPPEMLTIIGLKEELLQGRKAWRITARGQPGTDEPRPEWWVDQETFAVLRYAVPVKILKVEGDKRLWEMEYGDILSFKPNLEIPDELFAVPKDVPLRRPKFTETLEPKTFKKALPEGWEAFSFAKLEEAKAQGRITVLYFTAGWCKPCYDFEAGPLRDPRVGELLQPHVRLVVDLTLFGGEAAEVAHRYRIRAVPTLLFLDAQGNELGRISGYRSTSSLLWEIRKILEGGEK